MQITLTITTCKRIELFKETITSFFDNCLDTEMIKEIIIVDDNSKPNDIKDMKYFLKDYPYNIKIIHNKFQSHALALNELIKEVKTDYIFHLEDDWKFTIKGNFIKDCFEIMEDNEKIKTVIVRNWIEQGAKEQQKKLTKTGKYYYIHNYSGLKFEKGCINTYPGYSLNPSLQSVKMLKEIGSFENKKLFELRYAYRYNSFGYLVGLTAQDFCKHSGGACSAYKLNETEA